MTISIVGNINRQVHVADSIGGFPTVQNLTDYVSFSMEIPDSFMVEVAKLMATRMGIEKEHLPKSEGAAL